MHSIFQLYQVKIDKGEWQKDEAQAQVVLLLEDFLRDVSKKSWWRRANTRRGAYLWGPVGSGKTALMDLFLEAIPKTVPYMRLHFYQFMQLIHADLKKYQGTPDPLIKVAAHYARTVKLIALDEFLVEDIADAMILAGLLQAFLGENLYFLTTANIQPCQLYLNGLQRGRFLPAISLIEKHLQVLPLHSMQDYRINKLPAVCQVMSASFCKALSERQSHYQNSNTENKLLIHGRPIHIHGVYGKSVHTDQWSLCHGPRSSRDYLTLAAHYHDFFVDHVMPLNSESENEARRFIALIDVLYDQKCRLWINPTVPIEALYTGVRWQSVFGRTLSRLQELCAHQMIM